MQNDRTIFPRRTFLRGLGTAVALPWLESALPRSAWAAAGAAPAAPLRMAFLYIPNGAHMEAWTPEKEGADFRLTPTLEPLAAIREKVMVLSGLTADKARPNGDGAGDHARSAAAFLTGSQAEKTDGKGIRAGISVDQLAAEWLGKESRFPSLVVGCEPGRQAGDCDSGYSCAYSNNISWQSPTMPAGKEINPRALFDRLYGSGGSSDREESRAIRDQNQKSILDLVRGDARRLRRQLGQGDAKKLDEYLQGVREIERRIDHPGDDLFVDGKMTRPRGIPADYAKHVRLMADLLVLAFQTNQTRVATMMLANEGSVKTYPEIGVREGHHDLSHHQRREEKQRKIAEINRYHVQQLAYMLQRLDSIREGDGTLLDNTMLVYGSAISDGNRHNHDDLPILLAGGKTAGFQGGRHIRFPDETPLVNLYLRMLHIAGVDVAAIGDSTGELTGLEA
jgi:hypothetical protein